jgi:hypothetical protein
MIMMTAMKDDWDSKRTIQVPSRIKKGSSLRLAFSKAAGPPFISADCSGWILHTAPQTGTQFGPRSRGISVLIWWICFIQTRNMVVKLISPWSEKIPGCDPKKLCTEMQPFYWKCDGKHFRFIVYLNKLSSRKRVWNMKLRRPGLKEANKNWTNDPHGSLKSLLMSLGNDWPCLGRCPNVIKNPWILAEWLEIIFWDEKI